jgi:hypothetical protein
LIYQHISQEEYESIKAEYSGSAGNNVLDAMTDSDIPQLGTAGGDHFKVGNYHFYSCFGARRSGYPQYAAICFYPSCRKQVGLFCMR